MKLNVSKRNQPNQKIDLGKDVIASDYSETIFLIGRSKDCHVVLDDKQISREHVRIIHQNGKWFAEKTSAENSCLYNGEDFQRVELENDDVLTITNFAITVENESLAQVHQPVSAPVPAPVEVIKEEVKSEISPPAIKIEDIDSTGEVEINKDEVAIKEESDFLEMEPLGDSSSHNIGEVTADVNLDSLKNHHCKRMMNFLVLKTQRMMLKSRWV